MTLESQYELELTINL